MKNNSTLKLTQNWLFLHQYEKLSTLSLTVIEQNKIEILIDLVATQNPGLNEHLSNVMNLAIDFCNQKPICGQEDRHNLEVASLLHDIGKVGIPNDILLKQKELDLLDWEIIKKHPLYSANILFGFGFSFDIVQAVLYHHERWDGKGYPLGLHGESIPYLSRIVSILDVYEAITSDRPYRKAWSKSEAQDYIFAGKGTQFDPQVVDQFKGLID